MTNAITQPPKHQEQDNSYTYKHGFNFQNRKQRIRGTCVVSKPSPRIAQTQPYNITKCAILVSQMLIST